MLHELLVVGGARNKNSTLCLCHIVLLGDNILQYVI